MIERGGSRVRVYSVHLPSPFGISGQERREQVLVLLDDAERSKDPVVIAGDFNTRRVGGLLQRHGFTWVTRDLGPTTRFLFFGMRFDHIFVRGLGIAAGRPSCGVERDNRGASDHRPVWALLTDPRAPADGGGG